MKTIEMALLFGMLAIVIPTAVSAGADRPDVSAPIAWHFEYNQDGRLSKVTDPGGKVTQLEYSLDDKKQLRTLTREQSDAVKVVSEYNERGQRTAMTDAIGVVHYDYDEAGRLTSVRREGSPDITYAYDTTNRVTSIGAGKDFQTRYTFDFLNRLVAIDSPAGKITYEYQTGQNKIIRTLPNGVWTVWESGPDGKLKSLVHVARDNSLILKFDYSYRSDGLIQGIKEWSPKGEKTVAYEYDLVQRLISVNDSMAGATHYAYDALGNRTQLTTPDGRTIAGEFDWASRLTKYDGQECVHDASGNLTSYAGADGKMDCEFDGANQLKSVANAKGKVEYQYDGQGLLANRLADGGKTAFLADVTAKIWRPLAVDDGNGHQTYYVWRGQQPLAAVDGGNTTFFLEDHLGSIRCCVDKQGKPVRWTNYTPFGRPATATGASTLVAGFAGLFYDPGSGLYLTLARGYDSGIEQFLQRDPQQRIPHGSQKDLSAYGYCGADPVNFYDRSGAAADSFDAGQIWWSSFLQNDIFNSVYSKNTYSTWATTDNSPFWNIVGGMIGGPGGDAQQAWFGVGWGVLRTLTMPGADVVANVFALKGDLGENSNLGYMGAAMDVLLLGRGSIGREIDAAALKIWNLKTIEQSGQEAFAWVEPEMNNLGHTFDTVGKTFEDALHALDILWDVGIASNATWNAFNPSPTQSGSAAGAESQPGGSTASTGAMPGIAGASFVASSEPLSPEEYAAWKAGQAGGDPMGPSNIGGISLRGAGDALKHLGQLSGVALGPNGQLILISKDQGDLGLPPLRLEDVATIFRSVYERGESPFVSIDPDPKDPHGKTMLTRQAPATADTYPQWVLFEGDRVMKSYSLGTDNVTKDKVQSTIPDYASFLELGFFNQGNGAKDSNWERFWIVPAEVTRRQSTGKKLTLLDVPLKVKTEQMVMRDGKLETAPNPKPSPQAATFSAWFTKSYPQLCQEVRSQPPVESGIKEPVSVYTELERVALITGIAEDMRDQGVPMPAWMRDYPTRPCPVPATTPSLTVEKTVAQAGANEVHQIYGGVDLAPPDQDLHTVPASPQADSMVKSLPAFVPCNGPIEALPFNNEGEKYHAVALPGGDTRALGACRLEEADLTVPVPGGEAISLIRKFNSFSETSDVFGPGWTLDLPRLDQWQWPIERTGNSATTKPVFALSSPLNTWNEVFSRHALVPEVKGELLVPNRPNSSMLGVADGNDPRIQEQTSEIVFRDGRSWHFDKKGLLVATSQSPYLTVYRHDAENRVIRIEGWHGQKLRADIQIKYGDGARMASAVGSDGQEVTYVYGATSELLMVKRKGLELGYQYANGLVTQVSRNGKKVRGFEYNDRGELVSETDAAGNKKTIATTAAATGVHMVASRSQAGTQGMHESAEYDASLRPTRRTLVDGTQMHWQYDDTGAVRASVDIAGGGTFSSSRSADGTQVAWRFGDGVPYQAERDSAGRMTHLQRGKERMLDLAWNPDGQLSSATSERTSIQRQYGKDGILSSALLSAPNVGANLSQWAQLDYDELGRTTRVADSSGAEIRIDYDKSNRPGRLSSAQGTVEFQHDDNGRTVAMQTSWGDSQSATFDPASGDLQRLKSGRGDKQVTVDFEKGRPQRITGFDGGQFEVAYFDEGKHDGLPKQVRMPNGASIGYQYDNSGRLASVDCAGTYQLIYDYNEQGHLTGLRQAPVVPPK